MATLARLQRDCKLERLTAGADHCLILAALSLLHRYAPPEPSRFDTELQADVAPESRMTILARIESCYSPVPS